MVPDNPVRYNWASYDRRPSWSPPINPLDSNLFSATPAIPLLLVPASVECIKLQMQALSEATREHCGVRYN
jgi:hypothetical protein